MVLHSVGFGARDDICYTRCRLLVGLSSRDRDSVMIVRVRDRGQVTIPKAIRAACHIETGSRLLFVPIDAERFEVRVMPARRSMRELMELLADDGPVPDINAIREAHGDALDQAITTGSPKP